MTELQLWALVSLVAGMTGGLIGTVTALKSAWRRDRHCLICDRREEWKP